jgi:hypothetical protein
VLAKMGDRVSMIFTDVGLAGRIDGVELAHFATQCYPDIHVIVTSGLVLTKSLPAGATFMPKAWLPLDVLHEAQRASRRAAPKLDFASWQCSSPSRRTRATMF